MGYGVWEKERVCLEEDEDVVVVDELVYELERIDRAHRLSDDECDWCGGVEGQVFLNVNGDDDRDGILLLDDGEGNDDDDGVMIVEDDDDGSSGIFEDFLPMETRGIYFEQEEDVEMSSSYSSSSVYIMSEESQLKCDNYYQLEDNEDENIMEEYLISSSSSPSLVLDEDDQFTMVVEDQKCGDLGDYVVIYSEESGDDNGQSYIIDNDEILCEKDQICQKNRYSPDFGKIITVAQKTKDEPFVNQIDIYTGEKIEIPTSITESGCILILTDGDDKTSDYNVVNRDYLGYYNQIKSKLKMIKECDKIGSDYNGDGIVAIGGDRNERGGKEEMKNEVEKNVYLEWDLARIRLRDYEFVRRGVPCREKEFNLIFCRVEEMIGKGGGFIFVSGNPGTGKTMTIRLVCDHIKKLHESIEIIELNAMKMTSSSLFYSYLWFKLSNADGVKNYRNMKNSKRLLYNYFRSGEHRAIVIVLDEIEMLQTRNQEIFYLIFEWINMKGSDLTVIGISNMNDLIGQMNLKIQSRTGLNRFFFNTYQPMQLYEILVNRIGRHMNLFEDLSVVDYMSKKVGAIKGDARLVLEICRKSLRCAENENSKVNLSHVDKAIRLMRENACMTVLANSSFHQKVFCISVLIEIGVRIRAKSSILAQLKDMKSQERARLRVDITFLDLVMNCYYRILKRLKIMPLNETEVCQLAKYLHQIGVIALNWEDKSLQRSLRIKQDPDDILFAFRDEKKIQNIIQMENVSRYFMSSYSDGGGIRM